MKFTRRLFRYTIALLTLAIQPGLAQAKPKLLVTFVVDQMREDYLDRDREYFLPAKKFPQNGGFRWLESRGARFTKAEHLTLHAVTCSGHATISTGATPAIHGIYKNNWWDTSKQKEVYCVEDSLSKNINGKDQAASPRTLLAPTLGDEIKSQSQESQVYSVALKDRASIMLGGQHPDLSLWFDHKTMQWTSSDWYLPKGILPTWVTDENNWIEKQKTEIFKWNASIKSDAKLTSLGFLPSFPYSLPKNEPSSLASPYGIELTARMAKQIFNKNKLGQGKGTDVLNISFSATDYVGHQFGPNHRATLEIFKETDRAIADIMKTVLSKLSSKKVIFVLTADHGVGLVPEETVSNKAAGYRVKTKELNKEIEIALTERFGKIDSNWLETTSEFQYFMNPSITGVKRDQASEFLRDFLAKKEWVALAYTRKDLEQDKVTDPKLKRQIVASLPKEAFPDVEVIVKPFTNPDYKAVSHFTSYEYDTHVPLIIVGERFKPGKYDTEVFIHDLAPTLALALGVSPPKMAQGRILKEAIKAK